MIVVGFDTERGHFVNAVGHLTDQYVLDLIFREDYSEFDLCFSKAALCAAVVRFSKLPLEPFEELI